MKTAKILSPPPLAAVRGGGPAPNDVVDVIIDCRQFGVTRAEAARMPTLAVALELPSQGPRRILRDAEAFGVIVNYYRHSHWLPAGIRPQLLSTVKREAGYWGCDDLVCELKHVYPQREGVRQSKQTGDRAQRAAALRALAVALVRHDSREYAQRKLSKAQAILPDVRLDVPFYEAWQQRPDTTLPAAAWCALGEGYAAQGKNWAALTPYEQAVAAAGEDAALLRPALSGQGRALLSVGRYAEAARKFQAVLAIDDRHAVSLSRLAKSLRYQGQATAAQEVLMAAAEQQGEEAETHAALGAVQGQMGDQVAAIVSYLRALRCAPDRAEWHAAIATMHGKGNAPAAVLHWQEAVRCRSDSAHYVNRLALALYEQREYVAAAAAFTRALAIEPDNASYWHNLGNTYFFQR